MTVFALYLAAPALAALVGLRGHVVEYRSPAAWPGLPGARLLDTDYYAELTAWLHDALPLRSEGIALDSWIDYRLLGDSPSHEVLIGAEGELFLTESLAWPCLPGADPVRTVASARTLGNLLGTRGIELYLLLSPNKHSLYPERVPAAASRQAECAAAGRRELRARAARETTFYYVDVWSPFEAARDAGYRIFPRFGRHWDDYAGILQAAALVDAMATGLWEPTAIREVGTDERPAEIPLRFMNLEVHDPRPRHRVERPGVSTEGVRFRLAEGSIRWATRRITQSNGAGLVPGRTLVIGDSFMDQSVEALAAYCEELVVVHWGDAHEFPAPTARQIAASRRVVLQVVEDRRAELHPEQLRALIGALTRTRSAAPAPRDAGG